MPSGQLTELSSVEKTKGVAPGLSMNIEILTSWFSSCSSDAFLKMPVVRVWNERAGLRGGLGIMAKVWYLRGISLQKNIKNICSAYSVSDFALSRLVVVQDAVFVFIGSLYRRA
jgi:hypothetical protein